MKRHFAVLFVASVYLVAQDAAPPSVGELKEVRRIYVGKLTGGSDADALRDLIIASLNSTKLFVLTDNEERADAVLKGAADDKAFTDSFDSYESASGHQTIGKSASGTSLAAKAVGIYGGSSMGQNESHHSRERKHEAFATVRLCNKDGDVLWSTTQESLGAKFRSASADVAAKIARQISIDYEKERQRSRQASSSDTPSKIPSQ